MYNLTEYSDNYLKTSGSLWQYCKDIATVDGAGNIVAFILVLMLLIHLILKTK